MKEKLYIIAGPEFGAREGQALLKKLIQLWLPMLVGEMQQDSI